MVGSGVHVGSCDGTLVSVEVVDVRFVVELVAATSVLVGELSGFGVLVTESVNISCVGVCVGTVFSDT
jgi:hypothetical protein